VSCLAAGPLCHDDDACRRRRAAAAAQLRRDAISRPAVFVGTATCGLGAGAAGSLAAARAFLAEHAVAADVVEVGCIGMCSAEPLLDVQLPGRTRVSFCNARENRVAGILGEVLAGRIPRGAALGQHRHPLLAPWQGVAFLDEHPFFAHQTRWVLANCGVIDPTRIEEYLARGGYRALERVVAGIPPEQVCRSIEMAGLRGRGGGGFPTGKKWAIARSQPPGPRYLICNADEGDPGAFMDRAVIEGDPHRVLEGLAIGAWAIGATKAYIYIRAEYPLAIKRLTHAIAEAKAYGLLGSNILGSGFALEIAIKQGAGAFVCGEETALIQSIEGRRGMPRPRPPYPAQAGLFGKPTVINNVETIANVPAIIANGHEWFAAAGTAGSKGTKVFALSGKICRTGLVEVAMGTTLREIVFAIGGGIPGGKRYKAVQIGGPSGGCIPTQHLDIEIDYESLKRIGAMMGSGGLVVMDESTCMVDVAKFFMNFIQRESCGKCIPCREGTKRMLEILEAITRSRRNETGAEALQRFRGVMSLQRLAEVIQDTSLCGLGQTAPNPVLATLRWFRDEYEAHIYDRRCPAGVCADLLTYSIDIEACKGCGLCVKACPAGAILGTLKSPHYIVAEKCISCGSCAAVCRPGAVVVH
jgi:NADH:ubiquinone oxidoreductase subunit F (NADH-binding)/Pyruvate/2-oxoacid:ferredoxin oxidoreductase delta subunit